MTSNGIRKARSVREISRERSLALPRFDFDDLAPLVGFSTVLDRWYIDVLLGQLGGGAATVDTGSNRRVCGLSIQALAINGLTAQRSAASRTHILLRIHITLTHKLAMGTLG